MYVIKSTVLLLSAFFTQQVFAFDDEDTKIQAYLETHEIKAVKTNSGLYYSIEQAGVGKTAEHGDKVTVHYRGKIMDGNEFDSSYERNTPFTLTYGQGQVIKGWEEGLAYFPTGSKGTLYIPSNLGYGERGIGNLIPPNSTLVFDIEVLKVQSEAEYESEKKEMAANAKKQDVEKIEKYLKENKLKAKETESGLYYIIEQKGKGAQAEAGKTVSVHYKGTLLDGTKFDSSYDRSEPIEFKLGVGQVIKGWDEGIALLKEGSKGKLLIPSELAYGSRSAGKIPPYSVLIFDIELMDVKE